MALAEPDAGTVTSPLPPPPPSTSPDLQVSAHTPPTHFPPFLPSAVCDSVTHAHTNTVLRRAITTTTSRTRPAAVFALAQHRRLSEREKEKEKERERERESVRSCLATQALISCSVRTCRCVCQTERFATTAMVKTR